MKFFTLIAASSLAFFTPTLSAQDQGGARQDPRFEGIAFPPDAACDVTKPPYNAKGDGSTDDTRAIQQALLDKHPVIYLPPGVYLISDTLKWGERQSRQVLQGAGRQASTIRLRDRCNGFTDPQKPRAMVWTGQSPAQRFQNGLRDLTFDTGQENSGAIGVQYMANNQGGIHRVNIQSGDEYGLIGLDLGYSDEQGPCLIEDVYVKGFEVGISTKHAVDSVTLEYITVEGQRRFGFENDGQCISLRKFKSINSVPGYVNRRGASVTAIIDSEFVNPGEPVKNAALLNEAYLFARNIETRGFGAAIDNDVAENLVVVDGPDVDEFVSHRVLAVFPGKMTSLNLPIKDSPQIPLEPVGEWVVIPSAVSDGDTVSLVDRRERTQQIPTHMPGAQRAIDAGAKVLYYPRDETLSLYGELHLRGKVERVIGNRQTPDKARRKVEPPQSELNAQRAKEKEQKATLSKAEWNEVVRQKRFKNEGNSHKTDHHPVFIIEDGDAPVVTIERFDSQYSGMEIYHRSKRTLVVSSMMVSRIVVEEGAGDVFLDDVVCSDLRLAPGTKVWARQLNMEGYVGPRATNDGGDLWVLGLKTENDPLVIETLNGGQTEIIGGFVYANKDWMQDKVMFEVRDASFSGTFGEWVIRKDPFNILTETRGNETRLLRKGEAYPRGEGAAVPLLVAYADGNGGAPATPKMGESKSLSASEVKIAWTSGGGAVTGYAIEVSTDDKEFKVARLFDPSAEEGVVDGLLPDTDYTFRVAAVAGGETATSNPVKVRTARPLEPADGKGLNAQYFRDKNFLDPCLSKVHGVTLDWESGAGELNGKAFSVRYTGELVPRFTGIYTLSSSERGARLWLAGKLLFDTWSRAREDRPEAIVKLEAGKRYSVDFQVKIDPQGGNKKGEPVTLSWCPPGQEAETIPSTQLFPGKPPTETTVQITVAGEKTEIREGESTELVIERSGGQNNGNLEVSLGLAGSATTGVDVATVPTSVILPPGEHRLSVPVEALNDSRGEADETLKVTLLPNSAYLSVGWNPSIGIIDNDRPQPGAGTGISGTYFQDRDYLNQVGQRVDPEIKMGWNKAEPFPGVVAAKKDKKTNGYSVIWTGEIEPQFSEIYRFEIDASKYAGVELSVNGELLFQIEADDREVSIPADSIALEKGKRYPIEVKYNFHNFYGSAINLLWQSESQPLEVVPASQLFPGTPSE